jgi:hypothetical protein
MKKKLQFVTACIAALAACAPMAAYAERAVPFHGMISTVDQAAKTFTIAGKEKAREFKVTDKTVLTKAGTAAAMKDVAANEEVRGSYLKAADGSLEVKTAKLGPMTEAEKAASAKKSSKKKAKEDAASAASPDAASSSSSKP